MLHSPLISDEPYEFLMFSENRTWHAMEANHSNERREYYRGLVKVKLSHLTFEDGNFQGGRYLDKKNVRRLVEVFRIEGCKRYEPEHRISALIEGQHLQEALELSGISETNLFQHRALPPELRLGTNRVLRCLFGKHRVEAAQVFYVDPKDKWWIIELYDDAMPEDLSIDLRLDNQNAGLIPTGEIFRNFRSYQLQGRDVLANRWLARFSRSMRRDVRTLTRLWNGRLIQAFDDALSFPGLWPGLRLGALQRILPMGCFDELVCYLEHMLRSWRYIVDDDEYLQARVDPVTIEHLQGLTPIFSLSDRRKISSLMRDGSLFPTLHDGDARRAVHKRLLHFQGRITSFFTFTEDTIYLEGPAKALRSLLPGAPHDSTREAASKAYGSEGNALLQVDEDTFRSVEVAYGYDADIAYRNLWLYVLRHFPWLTGIAPRRRSRESAQAYHTREESKTKFACLAHALGYDTREITALRQEVHTPLIGQRAAEERYRPRSPVELPTRAGSQMTETAGREATHRSFSEPSFSEDDEKLETQFRWGKPFSKDFEEARKHLFDQSIYDDTEQVTKQFVTSFAITREIFLAFFGRAPEILIGPDSRPDAWSEGANTPASPALLQQRERLLGPEITAAGSRACSTVTEVPIPRAVQSNQARTSGSSAYTMQSDVEFSNSSINSRTSRVYMLTHEDIHEVGFMLQDSEGAYRMPLHDSQLGVQLSAFFERFNEPVVFYLYESGRFFLESLNSDRTNRRVQTLIGKYTFFSFIEKGIVYPRRSQLHSLITKTRIIFVRRRLGLEENLVRLPHSTKEQIAVLWELFPSIRPTRPAPWILEEEPFQHEPQRQRSSNRWFLAQNS